MDCDLNYSIFTTHMLLERAFEIRHFLSVFIEVAVALPFALCLSDSFPTPCSFMIDFRIKKILLPSSNLQILFHLNAIVETSEVTFH